jgi:uncharacterized protein YbjT (DUF2867 family)
MSESHSNILVVGAAGHFAGLVVPALASRGARVRGLVRNEKQGDLARQGGAAEVAVGDIRDRASLDAALRGMDAAFYISPVYQRDEAGMGQSFVAAAKAAGVRRIVFSSVIHPVIGALQNHIQKVPVEEALVESGMEFTILHPAVFYQNLVAAWPVVAKTDVFAEPFSAAARISRVDYRDVAEVAAVALTGNRLLNGTFELCADGGMDRGEVVAAMGEALKRPIEAAAPDFDTWAAQAKLPYDGDQKEELKAMYDFYDRYGLVGNALTLPLVLGREPRSIRQFFADLAAGTKTTAG